MKCATSTLHEQLGRRGAFFVTEPKEPNFFNDDELYASRFDWYKDLFSTAHPDQICGESSTHYTKLPTYQNTAARIRKHTPDARFVYVMRHPVERIVSHYIHEWTEGRASSSISRDVLADVQYVSYSSYARQLEPYLDLFGKEKVLPVFFEHLTTNKAKELERIARFLGDESAEPFTWHEEVGKTNVSQERLRKSTIRDTALSFGLLRKAKDALPQPVKEQIKAIWRMKKRPTLSKEATVFVSDVLEKDLAELSDLLHLDLGLDTFTEVAKVSAPVFR